MALAAIREQETVPELSKALQPERLRANRQRVQRLIRSTDITYVPIQSGFLYLVAIIDLVLATCVVMAVAEHVRFVVLRRSARRGAFTMRSSRDLQFTPGSQFTADACTELQMQ